MATEKLGKLTIDQLKKKEKDANKVMIASLIIFLVCFIALYIIKLEFIGVTIPILAPLLIAMGERKRINNVLIDRIEKQDVAINELRDQRK